MKPGTRFGILLAGGEGRRLGAGEKPLVQVGGVAMIERAVAVLSTQVQQLAISANRNENLYRRFDLPLLPDRFPGQSGPLAGVHAGLAWAEASGGGSEDLVTAPGDAPFLPQDLVHRLASARDSQGADIAVAASGQRSHPVCALWPVSCRPALERALADGIRKIERFTAAYRVVRVEWETRPLDPFFNVNTREDLARAEALAGEFAVDRFRLPS